MGYCMRKRCVWASKLDSKCHVPCMDRTLVLSARDIAHNRILCRRFHAVMRVQKQAEKLEGRDDQERSVTTVLAQQRN